MPIDTDWTPSIIMWSIAFLWLIGTLIYLFKKRRNKQLTKLKENASVTLAQALSIEIEKAFSSVGESRRDTDGITRLAEYIVDVELTLKTTYLGMSLSWIKLCIGRKQIKPFESNPTLRDTINPTGESYELKFKVPKRTFLKGRYSTPTAIAPDSDEPEAQIYVKAGGVGRYSREFTIQHQELDSQI